MATNSSNEGHWAVRPVAKRAELEPVYRSAEYDVETESETLILRIGAPVPEITSWMNTHGLRRVVLFTACNPGSRPATARDNEQRQRRLEQAVANHGLRAWPACNRDPLGHWPDEPGLAIADLSDSVLVEWLEHFDQNAVVLLEPPAVPRLVWHPAVSGRESA